MDIPHVLNDIIVRYGLKGYKREFSTFSQKTDAVGLSAFFFFLQIRWLLF